MDVEEGEMGDDEAPTSWWVYNNSKSWINFMKWKDSYFLSSLDRNEHLISLSGNCLGLEGNLQAEDGTSPD